ncbi:hypothetical protein ACPCA8_34280 [Streptomyces capoamus]|uniref:hypothetical protein n=1 Tax=Streptomyces capoamus TaxID=68183 RepID=UPI003C2BDC57
MKDGDAIRPNGQLSAVSGTALRGPAVRRLLALRAAKPAPSDTARHQLDPADADAVRAYAARTPGAGITRCTSRPA